MNVNPAALNALAVAEEIGLFAGQVSGNVPSIPLDDIVDGIVFAAAAVSASTTTAAASTASSSAGVASTSSAAIAGTGTAVPSTAVDGTVDVVIAPADVDGAAASTVSVLGYIIEGIDDVAPQVKRHAVAFYNWLIPKFQEASAQFFCKQLILLTHSWTQYLPLQTNPLQNGPECTQLASVYTMTT